MSFGRVRPESRSSSWMSKGEMEIWERTKFVHNWGSGGGGGGDWWEFGTSHGIPNEWDGWVCVGDFATGREWWWSKFLSSSFDLLFHSLLHTLALLLSWLVCYLKVTRFLISLSLSLSPLSSLLNSQLSSFIQFVPPFYSLFPWSWSQSFSSTHCSFLYFDWPLDLTCVRLCLLSLNTIWPMIPRLDRVSLS